MIRTATSVRMLQVVAVVTAAAITLWSLGLTPFSFAQAANVTNISDVIGDSSPSATTVSEERSR